MKFPPIPDATSQGFILFADEHSTYPIIIVIVVLAILIVLSWGNNLALISIAIINWFILFQFVSNQNDETLSDVEPQV